MTPATRRRVVLIGIVLALWACAAAWKSVGRPLVGADLAGVLRILSDSLPSLVGGLTVPLAFLAVHPDPSVRDVPRVCLWSAGLLVLAETVELAFRTSRFDWYDVVLSLAGVALTGLLAARMLPGPRAA